MLIINLLDAIINAKQWKDDFIKTIANNCLLQFRVK